MVRYTADTFNQKEDAGRAGVSFYFIYGIIYVYSGLDSFIHEDSPIIAPVRDAPGLLFLPFLIKYSNKTFNLTQFNLNVVIRKLLKVA